MSYENPELFIGSSTKSLPVVDQLALALQQDAKITRWNEEGFFQAGDIILDRLLEELPRFDFAVLVFGFDDILESGNGSIAAPRDNVLFELGLFMSRLGRDRVYVLASQPDGKKIKILSDIGGLVYLPIRVSDDVQQLKTNLAGVVTQIRAKILKVRRESAPKVAQPTSPGDVHDLMRELEAVLTERLGGRPPRGVQVRNLALDMEVTWANLRDRYLDRKDVTGISWRSLMIDPSSAEILEMQSTTLSAKTASTQMMLMLATLPGIAGSLHQRFIDFEVRAYASIPAMHGFLVDDDILFLSFCRVKQKTLPSGEPGAELVGSPNAYWCFDLNSKNPSAVHFIQAFASWFDYLWQGSRKVWPAEPEKGPE